MLTYDQAVYFLENVLRMPPKWRDLLQNKPLEFLTLYMKRHAVRVPFQNFDMAATGPTWFPSEGDIAQNGLNGKGGCCMHLNYFTKLVFQAIGLETFVVRGDHYRAPAAGTHVLVMVKLYGPVEGVYLVEVGGAFPMLEPVPMDKHKLPYRTTQAAGFPYEFREIKDGWVGKFHLKGGVIAGEYNGIDETLRTYWEMKPRGFWEFDYGMLESFSNPEVSSLLRQPLMCRHFGNAEFRRLFPELPENANAKERNLVSKPMSKIGKVLAASGRPKKAVQEKKEPEKTTLIEITNLKNEIANGKTSNGNVKGKSEVISKTVDAKAKVIKEETKEEIPKLAVSGKQPSIQPTKTLIIPDEEESDEYEVVTEEEISEEEDDPEEDPKNFVCVWKRRIVIGDDKTRKIVKDYKSYDEMEEDLRKYFPRVSADTVKKALKAFSKYEVKPSAYDLIL